jgi:putative endonuclease
MSYEVAQPHFGNKIAKSGCEECPSGARRAKGDIFVFWYNFSMHYVYILQLKDKSFYHGSAADLTERIKDHKHGLVLSTKNMRPFTLAFYAAFTSKQKAMQFEKYLKTASGWAFRNKRLI